MRDSVQVPLHFLKDWEEHLLVVPGFIERSLDDSFQGCFLLIWTRLCNHQTSKVNHTAAKTLAWVPRFTQSIKICKSHDLGRQRCWRPCRSRHRGKPQKMPEQHPWHKMALHKKNDVKRPAVIWSWNILDARNSYGRLWLFPASTISGLQPPCKILRKKHSNPQIFMSYFWHELFEGLQQPTKTPCTQPVGSDPQIFEASSTKYL